MFRVFLSRCHLYIRCSQWHIARPEVSISQKTREGCGCTIPKASFKSISQNVRDPPGGCLFRLQDVEKQRERRKTKAKKGRKKKEEKLGTMKNPHKFVGFFSWKLGKESNFWIKGTHQVGSPPKVILFSEVVFEDVLDK